MQQNELDTIIAKRGYGIVSEIGKGSINSSFGSKGKVRDVEQRSGYESLRAQAVALNYSGKCEIRIKFFRKRLADYSRANCEKYIIDSLVYAGLIRDDSEKEIWLIDEGQEKVKTDAEERVVVTINYPEVTLDPLWVPRDRFGNIGQKKK
jgi:hypothetical protein